MVKLGKLKKKQLSIFNNFFGNILKNLYISQYSDFDSIIENVNDPTLKAILKYIWRFELNVIGMVFLVLVRSV